MLSRHSNEKELKEMDTQILYKSDGNYYIEEIIPGEYSDRGDSITHYQSAKCFCLLRKTVSSALQKSCVVPLL